ncbi:MAG: C39 family peptidase [Phycisphaerales bacterium]
MPRRTASRDEQHDQPPPPAVLPLHIEPQPNDETCGPTCLHAVYRYWGDGITLDGVIESARSLNIAGAGRGTLAVMLGVHALTRGYRATLYTYNLHTFDPTWFNEQGRVNPDALQDKLRAQAQAKTVEDARFQVATDSYLEFCRLGGVIRFRDLSSGLISRFIRGGKPVLTGLSATYLYRCAREFGPNDDYDDIRGEPAGHFVVLHGYEPKGRRVTIADPLANNPGFVSQRYEVPMSRLVPAIMLGVMTYDANLLVIEPDS